MTRTRLAAGLAALTIFAGVSVPATAQGDGTITEVRVDARSPLGAVNRSLVGVGWHPGGQPLAVVKDLEPRIVRIDASLQDISPGPGVVRLTGLLEKVAAVRALGAEPLVILSYMPAWLGGPNARGRDATRVAPADLDAWERLIYDVVHALATAPSAARRFEAWNEPNIPIFWQDTPTAWSAMITRTARAIAAVETATGLDLSFGGPATAVPDPVYLAAFLTPLRDAALPLDFVSWHYYGNTPFFGPDGNEFGAAAPIYPVVGRPNPLASPSAYGAQVGLMRDWTTALLAGASRPAPALVIDEWNLSPGGFDRRHDSNEGAAFAAGVLVEMQEAGLDESAFFQVDDEVRAGGSYGGHGLVGDDGVRKPAWWSFWLWQQQAGQRVAVTGASSSEGLWAHAAVDPKRATVLLASFSASQPAARDVVVEIDGLGWQPAAATVRRIDADRPAADAAEPLALDAGSVRLTLPAQGVALVELTAAPGKSTALVGTDQLPATGASVPLAVAFVALAIAALLRAGQRGASTD